MDRDTCFKIYFRRDETLPEELEAGVINGDGPQGDVTGGGLILLVEDEDPVRLFSAQALRSKGYKVVEASGQSGNRNTAGCEL